MLALWRLGRHLREEIVYAELPIYSPLPEDARPAAAERLLIFMENDRMKHVRYDEVESKEVTLPGAEGVRVRWLVGAEDDAPNFYMRRFELVPGGRTPRHEHAWEHEVYILEGAGVVFHAGSERPVRPGDVVYMPAGEEHYFGADQAEALAFLCLIPKR